MAFLNAELVRGIELVLDATQIDEQMQGIDLVITGEGFLDRQTLMGKAPAGVAARARRRGIPCLGIGGGVEQASRKKLNAVFAKLETVRATHAALAAPAQAGRHIGMPAH